MDTVTRDPVELPPDHRSARSRTRARRWPVALLCLLVIAAIGATIWLWPTPAKSPTDRSRAGQAVPVLTAEATLKDVPIFLDGLGTVQAFNTVTVKPMIDGPLMAVNFREGQEVRKGDVLAQIDPRPYQAALDQAVAKKAQDEAVLANARMDLVRYQKLVANNYTSAQQADTARAQVAQDEAIVRQDQAAIDTARTNLSYTTITAQIDGRTGIRQVDVGNIVHASDTTGIVVITQLQPISVVFTLPQQSLPAVARAAREGGAKALAYMQGANGGSGMQGGANGASGMQGGANGAFGGGLLDTGTLAVLDNQVDSTTGTIKLKATFPNPDHRLWPGGFVGVRLQVEIARNAVTVPPSAVQRGPRGPYVFVVSPDETTRRQNVVIGHEDEQASIVTEGLKGGEQVVTDGASRLSDGSKVSLAKPAAARDADAQPHRPAAPGTRQRRGE